MNLVQIVIPIAIITLTVCLVFLSIWIIKILKEFRQTVMTTNLILDDAKSITSNINQPISQIKDFFAGLKEGVNFFSNLIKKDE